MLEQASISREHAERHKPKGLHPTAVLRILRVLNLMRKNKRVYASRAGVETVRLVCTLPEGCELFTKPGNLARLKDLCEADDGVALSLPWQIGGD